MHPTSIPRAGARGTINTHNRHPACFSILSYEQHTHPIKSGLRRLGSSPFSNGLRVLLSMIGHSPSPPPKKKPTTKNKQKQNKNKNKQTNKVDPKLRKKSFNSLRNGKIRLRTRDCGTNTMRAGAKRTLTEERPKRRRTLHNALKTTTVQLWKTVKPYLYNGPHHVQIHALTS